MLPSINQTSNKQFKCLLAAKTIRLKHCKASKQSPTFLEPQMVKQVSKALPSSGSRWLSK